LTGAVMGLVGKRWHAEENKNLSTLLHYKDWIFDHNLKTNHISCVEVKLCIL
jgi:hypothetical protein